MFLKHQICIQVLLVWFATALIYFKRISTVKRIRGKETIIWEGEGEKKLWGVGSSGGHNMQSTAQVYQLLMCHTKAHHAAAASIPAHWHLISVKEIHDEQNQEQNKKRGRK